MTYRPSLAKEWGRSLEHERGGRGATYRKIRREDICSLM